MRKLLCNFLFIVCAMSAHGGVLVNEAMVNEPHDTVTFEWIELYNDSNGYVDINNYTLDVNGTSFNLFNSSFLPPNGYMIICRKLIDTVNHSGFESKWGNNSGFWGDTPEEAALPIAEESFTLLNTVGYIRLYSVSTLLSELNWPNAGGDGYSWERISASNNAAVNSADPSGSTPGRANSVSPVALDLELDSVWHTSLLGGASIRVELFNRGTDSAKTQSLLLYRRQPTDSTDTQDTIVSVPVDPLGPGNRDTLSFYLEEPGIYAQIGLLLSPDGRATNNSAFIRVTGQQYPPIILSEFLPDPALPLASEWIELLNVSDSTINLAGWRVGDELNLREITGSLTPLFPGERVVVAQDTIAFRSFYTGSTVRVFQPGSWPSLNNTGDLVRLYDSFGFAADRYQYTEGFADNYTIARDQTQQSDGPWLRSASAGGTPGQVNTVWTQPTSDRTTVAFEPQVFSPDGDGFEDETTLRLTVVDASAYTLKIYDRTGNLVKTFLDSEPLSTSSISWDGRSDAGNRLPIGIYICFFEAEGVESIKETVVIAR